MDETATTFSIPTTWNDSNFVDGSDEVWDNSTFSDDNQETPGLDLEMLISGLVYGITFIVGVIGNGLIIYSVTNFRSMKSLSNIFLANLASADLMLIFLCVPVKFAQMFSYTWTFGEFLCKFVHYTQTVSAMCSVLTLTAMSIERYYAIINPIKSRSICTISKTKRTIVMIWLLSLIMSTPIFWVEILRQVGEGEHYWCVRDWDNKLIWQLYECYMLTVILLIPFTIMTYSYAHICKKMFYYDAPQNQTTTATPATSASTSTSWITTAGNTGAIIGNGNGDGGNGSNAISIDMEDDINNIIDEQQPHLIIDHRKNVSNKKGHYDLQSIESIQANQNSQTQNNDIQNYDIQNGKQNVEQTGSIISSISTNNGEPGYFELLVAKFKKSNPNTRKNEQNISRTLKNENIYDNQFQHYQCQQDETNLNKFKLLKMNNDHSNANVNVNISARARNNQLAKHVQVTTSSRQVIKMLIAVIVIFLICWSPILIINVMTAFEFLERLNYGYLKPIRSAANLFSYANSCVNPIIYGFMSHSFRASFKAAIAKCITCSSLFSEQQQQKQNNSKNKNIIISSSRTPVNINVNLNTSNYNNNNINNNNVNVNTTQTALPSTSQSAVSKTTFYQQAL